MPWPAVTTPGAWTSTPTAGGFTAPAASSAMARGTGGMGATGGFGSGTSGMGTSSMGSGGTGSATNFTWGHDTHPDWENPEPERDPSQGFYNDRRSEGRRHEPKFGGTGGEVPPWLKKAVERHTRARSNGRTIWHPDIQTDRFLGLEPGESQGYWGKSHPRN